MDWGLKHGGGENNPPSLFELRRTGNAEVIFAFCCGFAVGVIAVALLVVELVQRL